MKSIRAALFVLLTLAAFAPQSQARLIGTAAPELSNEVWIHSKPLRLRDLRGQVVLLEFWTYG